MLRTWRALGLENVGGPDFGYRGLGGVIGLGIAGALWLNARLLGGERNAPWFSLGLFAAGGFAVRVGDSVRPYGLGWLFMLLTFGWSGAWCNPRARAASRRRRSRRC